MTTLEILQLFKAGSISEAACITLMESALLAEQKAKTVSRPFEEQLTEAIKNQPKVSNCGCLVGDSCRCVFASVSSIPSRYQPYRVATGSASLRTRKQERQNNTRRTRIKSEYQK